MLSAKNQLITVSEIVKTFTDYSINKSKLFTRKYWSKLLRISEPAISQWFNGKTKIPSSKNLLSIYKLLNKEYRKNKEVSIALDSIESIIDKELSDTEKKDFKNVASLGDYMVQDEIQNLLFSIEKLPFILKVELIKQFNLTIRKISQNLNSDYSNVSENLNYLYSLNPKKKINKPKLDFHIEDDKNNEENPIISLIKPFSIFEKFANILAHENMENEIIKSYYHFVPIDYKVIKEHKFYEELELYQKIFQLFKTNDSENIINLLDEIESGFKNESLLDFSPGLLLKLTQILTYKCYEFNDFTTNKMILIREKLFKIFKFGIMNKYFMIEDISPYSITKIIDHSICTKDEDFIKYSDKSKSKFKTIRVWDFHELNKNIFSKNLKRAQKIIKKEKPDIDESISLEFKFLKLRYFWVMEEKENYRLEHDAIKEFMKNYFISLEKEKRKIINKRTNWYDKLYSIPINSPEKIKEHCKQLELETVDDCYWLLNRYIGETAPPIAVEIMPVESV